MYEPACLASPLSKGETIFALNRPILELNMCSPCPDRPLTGILVFSFTFLLIPSFFLFVWGVSYYTKISSSGSSYFLTF